MPSTPQEVSVLNIGDTNYNIKDATARTSINSLTNRVSTLETTVTNKIQSILNNIHLNEGVTWTQGGLSISEGKTANSNNNTYYRTTDFIPTNRLAKIIPNVGYKFQIFCYNDNNQPSYQGSWDGTQAVTVDAAIMYQLNTSHSIFNISEFGNNIYPYIKLVVRKQDNSSIDPADFMPLYIITSSIDAVTAAQTESILAAYLANSQAIEQLRADISATFTYASEADLNLVDTALARLNDALSSLGSQMGTNINTTDNTDFAWAIGTLSRTTGKHSDSTTRIYLPTVLEAAQLVKITPLNDYSFVICVYSENNYNSFVGMLDTQTNTVLPTTISLDEVPWTNKEYFLPKSVIGADNTILDEYYIRIAIKNSLGTTIETSDNVNIKIYQIIEAINTDLHDDVAELNANYPLLEERIIALEQAAPAEATLPAELADYAETIANLTASIEVLTEDSINQNTSLSALARIVGNGDPVLSLTDSLARLAKALGYSNLVPSYNVPRIATLIQKNPSKDRETILFVQGIESTSAKTMQLISTIIKNTNVSVIIGGGNYFTPKNPDDDFVLETNLYAQIGKVINGLATTGRPFLAGIGYTDNNYYESDGVTPVQQFDQGEIYNLLQKHMEQYDNLTYFSNDRLNFYYDLPKSKMRILFVEPAHYNESFDYDDLLTCLNDTPADYHIVLVAPEIFDLSATTKTLTEFGNQIKILVTGFNAKNQSSDLENYSGITYDFTAANANTRIVLVLTNGNDYETYTTDDCLIYGAASGAVIVFNLYYNRPKDYRMIQPGWSTVSYYARIYSDDPNMLPSIEVAYYPPQISY